MPEELPKPMQGPWDWSLLVPDREWQVYRRPLDEATRQGLPFVVGGGMATSFYTRHRRNTKDMDLLVLPRDREAFIDILNRTGFEDYYKRMPYRRSWIYRGYREGVILDVIWQMANDRAPIDEQWLERGPVFEVRGLHLRLVPVEELMWTKLYIMHRDRCDWPDLFNMLLLQGPTLDWEHLLSRVGEDHVLLGSMLTAYRWLCPAGARALPGWLWSHLRLDDLPEEPAEAGGSRRAHLLDSYHAWFGPRDLSKEDSGGPIESSEPGDRSSGESPC